MSNPNHATVRRTLLPGRTVPQWLSDLDAVIATAAQCTEVQSDPICAPAFVGLKQAVTTAHTDLDAKQQLALKLLAAIKTLRIDVTNVRIVTRAYEGSVAALAKGNAQIINKAGLAARVVNPPPAALTKVSVVHCKVGKHPCEAIITWPAAPGATGYAIEVNFTPQNPAGQYTALNSGTGRRRIVKGPTPGCQFLVRIASLGSGGAQADWTDAVLATAL